MNDFSARAYISKLDIKLSFIEKEKKEKVFLEEINNLDYNVMKYLIVFMMMDYCKYGILTSTLKVDDLEFSIDKVYEKLNKNGVNLYDIYQISLDISNFSDIALSSLEKIELPDWKKYNMLVNPSNKVEILDISNYYRYYLYNYFNPFTKDMGFLNNLKLTNNAFYEELLLLIYSDYYRIYKDMGVDLEEYGCRDFKLNSKIDFLEYIENDNTIIYEWLELVLNDYFYYNKKILMELELPKWIEESSVVCKLENKIYNKRKK